MFIFVKLRDIKLTVTKTRSCNSQMFKSIDSARWCYLPARHGDWISHWVTGFWLTWFINQRALYNHALSIVVGVGINIVLHLH